MTNAERRAFYFKHYIGTSEEGFVKYNRELDYYSEYVKDFERKFLYENLSKQKQRICKL